MSIFSWIGNLLCESPIPYGVDVRRYVDLKLSINELDIHPKETVLSNIEIGDYIEWSETSGQPGDKWYCGRSCYGIVKKITDYQYVVIGTGYYGIGNTILTCTKTKTNFPGYLPLSNHGITFVSKRKNIVWGG